MATRNDSKPDPQKVVTGTVRLSYAHLFEPWSGDAEQDARYSTVLLIPKTADGKATLKKIRAAQQAALEEGKTKKFGGRIPKSWTDTVHDGDEEADLEKNPEYEGHWYMTVGSKQKPGLVDQDVNPILDSTELYSGCYARVSMRAYPFNTQGNKGVSFGLNHVQKVKDGEAFSGRSSAEDDFEAIDAGDGDDEGDDLI